MKWKLHRNIIGLVTASSARAAALALVYQHITGMESDCLYISIPGTRNILSGDHTYFHTTTFHWIYNLPHRMIRNRALCNAIPPSYSYKYTTEKLAKEQLRAFQMDDMALKDVVSVARLYDIYFCFSVVVSEHERNLPIVPRPVFGVARFNVEKALVSASSCSDTDMDIRACVILDVDGTHCSVLSAINPWILDIRHGSNNAIPGSRIISGG